MAHPVVMVRTLTLTTGTKPFNQRGFTLVEIVAAITVVGLVLAIGVPQSLKFYESQQYRAAIRETMTLLNSARHAAIAKAEAQDVEVSPSEKWVRFGDQVTQFDESIDIAVHSAREVNRGSVGVIRFYPEGGASGGGIDITRNEDQVVTIEVDWLVGRVSVDFGHADKK